MPVVNVCLEGFTGKTLQEFLANQVDCQNWKKEITYKFHQDEYNTRPIFTINPNPTEKQSGNAKVEFVIGQNSYSWTLSTLADVYHRNNFPHFRKEYLGRDFEELMPVNDVLAANVLLSFEIARRERIPEKYPLRRFEVKEAIERVMSFNVVDGYNKKVNYRAESWTAQ